MSFLGGFFDPPEPSRPTLRSLIITLIRKVDRMSKEIDDLKAAVAKNVSVTQSAVTLISGLAQQIKDAAGSGDLAQVEELATTLSNNADALGAAVSANTPAAPDAPAQGDQSGSGGASAA